MSATRVRNGYIWGDGGQNDGLPCPLTRRTSKPAKQSSRTNNWKNSRTSSLGLDRSPLFASGRRPIRVGDEVMQVSCQLLWSHPKASMDLLRSAGDPSWCRQQRRALQGMANKVGEIKHSISAEHHTETALESIARIAIQGVSLARATESSKSARKKGRKKERKRKRARAAEGDSESDRD